jgi:hypothetical protein
LIKKEEEFLKSTNPKHKMMGMLLKMRRQKNETKKANQEKAPGVPSDYAPQRQDHCFLYVFHKKLMTDKI